MIFRPQLKHLAALLAATLLTTSALANEGANSQVSPEVRAKAQAALAKKEASKPVAKSSKKAKKSKARKDAETEASPAVAKAALVQEANKSWTSTANTHLRVDAGVVRFPYPYVDMEPVLECASLNVCLLELNEDEWINRQAIGDSANWEVVVTEEAGAFQNRLVAIRPLASGLSTNLQLITNKRVYAVNLKSTSTSRMSRYGFYYGGATPLVRTFAPPPVPVSPADAAAAAALAAEMSKSQYVRDFEATLPKADTPLAKYVVKGKAAFKPVEVYSDGQKTFIKMPSGLQELPVLAIVDKDGNLGMSPQIRYSTKERLFSVDFVIDRAALVLGNGDARQRIDITKPDFKE